MGFSEDIGNLFIIYSFLNSILNYLSTHTNKIEFFNRANHNAADDCATQDESQVKKRLFFVFVFI